jgi:hypothetical protein
MLIKSFCATLCAVAFVVACGSSAFASNTPIPGIDVVVKKKPSGTAVNRATTDAKGEITIKELPAGQYTIELSGKGKGTGKGAEPASRPVTHPAKEGAGGVLQVDIVIPEGPAKSYKLTLTQ